MPGKTPRRWRAAAPLIAIAVLAAPGAGGSDPPAADLRLEWPGGASAAERPIRGTAGSTTEVGYRLANVGGDGAYAALISAHTALGPVGRPLRLRPGPDAGEVIERSLRLALARGMRELCLGVKLQNLRAEDPDDPNPSDNRICRRIEIEESAGARR